MKLLTNLIFEPKGKHNSSLAYNIKDTVMSADGSKVYFALQDVPAGTALSNTDYWMLQIDLSGTKSAVENALASFGNYAKDVGTRVKGETAKVSGNPATCLADAGSLLQPVTVLEPKQEGSGNPSPDNIRPISGFDALSLVHAGKNLLPNTAATTTDRGLTYTVNDDGTITVKGTCTASNALFVIGETMLPAGDYVVSGDTGNPLIWVYVNGERIYPNNYRFTLSETALVKCPVYVRAESYDTVLSPMIRLASETDATYEPHQGKTHTVQIGRTVYGGKFDWLTGEIVITNGYKILTGTETYTSVSGGGVITSLTDAAAPVVGGVEAWCSHYKRTGSTNASGIANGEFAVSHLRVSNSPRLFIRDDVNGANATALRDYIAAQYAAGTPVEVSYELAEPTRIPITPAIISAAEPEQVNTLYGDGGIEVEYVKPLHVSIEERVAAAVAAAMQN